MDRLEHIAKLGDFIPHGDDSFIDDAGITNSWAQRRRRRAEDLERAALERARNNVFGEPITLPPAPPTAYQRDMAAEELRNLAEAQQDDLEHDGYGN